MNKNIIWHNSHLTRLDRNKFLNFSNKVLWFTGLSGCGKSTIAHALQKQLHDRKILCYVLDGDNVRHGLNSDLGFTLNDRKENIRRIAEVSKLFYDAGIMVLVSFISPLREDRDFAKKLIGNDFIEIFVDCDIEECEKRDTKGLYKKARNGLIKNFTGISSPYEIPLNPKIILYTQNETIEESVLKILKFLE